jgi:hypothetical protein
LRSFFQNVSDATSDINNEATTRHVIQRRQDLMTPGNHSNILCVLLNVAVGEMFVVEALVIPLSPATGSELGDAHGAQQSKIVDPW